MARTESFLQALQHRIVVGDGAFGTLLYEKGIPFTECYDDLNLRQPEIVSAIHRDYVDAGAEMLETNTFGANLWKLRHYGLADKVCDINRRGAEIALECAQGAAWVAGAMGPLGRIEQEPLTDGQKEDIFREQARALIEAGVQAIILETFPSLRDALAALRAVKSVKNIPAIAQLVFTDSGRTADGHGALQAFWALKDAGADAVGANCGIGPNGIYKVLAPTAVKIDIPVSAFPNAGFPERREDRLFYGMNAEYLAEIAGKLVSCGVNLIGGCCGTSPADIRTIKAAVSELQPMQKPSLERQSVLRLQSRTEPSPGLSGAKSRLHNLLSQRRVISVELDPPKTLKIDKVLQSAQALKDAGADVISIAENPLAVVRMSNVAMARLIQTRIGIETIVHITGRDRNLIGLQSEFMGMAMEGLQNVLAVTGDPPSRGKEEKVKGVFDLHSLELIALLTGMNQGRNYYGDDLKQPTAFTIGAAFNPNVTRLEAQVRRMRRKIANGAQFFQTQPVFSKNTIDEMLIHTQDISAPILLGILPLVSFRNAEFLHNEFPGISIPDDIRARMRRAGEKGVEEGIQIAWELIEYAAPHFAGIYIMPPFNRCQIAVELIRRMHKAVM